MMCLFLHPFARNTKFRPDPRWCIDFKDSAGDDVREGVWVSAAESEELQGGHGATANCVFRWKGTTRDATVSVVTGLKGVTQPSYSADLCGREGAWVVAFECRNAVPVRWHPQGTYAARAAGEGSSCTWGDVTLDEEWGEYDEKAGVPVAVRLVSHSFERRATS